MHAREVGSVIRGARAAARMTQAQLGELCGYSSSAISRVEGGRLRLAPETLLRVAEVLRIAPEELGVASHPVGRPVLRGAAGAQGPAARVAGTVMVGQEDAVRRRELLAGVVGVGAALVASPASAVPVQAAVPADPVAPLERALFQPLSAEPVPPGQLSGTLAAARADFSAARYRALGEALPGLLAAAEASRDAASGLAREQAQMAVARGYVLATELAVKQHSDVAWATADRALTAARASGDPVVIGEAARVLAITMRRAGRAGAAVDLLRDTASALGEQRGRAPRAVEATLLMTAAYTAACNGRRGDALDLMRGAQDAVEQVPADGPGSVLFTVDATAAQADLYWIGVHNALGTPDEAVRYAARIDPALLPTAERRARLGTDAARMWHQLGDHRRTFAALRLVEHAAPEEVRRPALRAMTAGLLYGPVALPGLKEFAQRTGVA
ncbi:helix-turn-helix domain-containing protein [Kitasatospora atroaurantiaca]|uniref:helix-turn-helix domain-containing protein n=1 Tax=Kitasatospora atroaurantiaca TaxID=285545 RepID=UPI0024822628|nr:helix-turn-helix transcriptional regulator [Kitasatospora atroaurantiaca]